MRILFAVLGVEVPRLQLFRLRLALLTDFVCFLSTLRTCLFLGLNHLIDTALLLLFVPVYIDLAMLLAITGLESLFCLSAIHRVSEALARHRGDSDPCCWHPLGGIGPLLGGIGDHPRTFAGIAHFLTIWALCTSTPDGLECHSVWCPSHLHLV
jgi:hypothetical protein